MKPNDTHLDLLRKLPASVMAELHKHTPGWLSWITAGTDGDALSWKLLQSGKGNWLPCDPTAILKVAVSIHGGRKRWGSIYIDSDGFEASVTGYHNAPDAVGRAGAPSLLELYGEDAHEAVLRLLLAVCVEKGTAAIMKYEFKPLCPCFKCKDNPLLGMLNPATMFMICCTECGNKRCPHSTDHTLACTGSNESGQEGSRYP